MRISDWSSDVCSSDLTSKEPIDGISIAGVFKGQKIERNAPLFFEHYGARGILDGRWKLVSLAPEGPGHKRKTYRPWHLYDIATDRTEMHDLADAHPEIVPRLDREWKEWGKDEVGRTSGRERVCQCV